MQRVSSAVAFSPLFGTALLAAVLVCVTGGAAGESSPADGDSNTGNGAKRTASVNEPMSIFNDKLRAFRFRLKHTDVVTIEEAYAFTQRYSKRGNPEIIGAYPDPDENVLVVIGPPEAEQAIRKSLATSIIEVQGLPGGRDLKIKKRVLLSQGKSLIADMAAMELAKVEVAATKDERRAAKLKDLDSRLLAFQAELDVIEKQIVIVDKYLKRLSEKPYGTAK